MSQSVIELELVATGRPRLLASLRELWAYRGTILAFAERDVRVKCKQAVLGVAWALLQPLAFLATSALFFRRPTKIGGDGTTCPSSLNTLVYCRIPS